MGPCTRVCVRDWEREWSWTIIHWASLFTTKPRKNGQRLDTTGVKRCARFRSSLSRVSGASLGGRRSDSQVRCSSGRRDWYRVRKGFCQITCRYRILVRQRFAGVPSPRRLRLGFQVWQSVNGQIVRRLETPPNVRQAQMAGHRVCLTSRASVGAVAHVKLAVGFVDWQDCPREEVHQV
jgi:hypothetical protein